jgi:S-adenosylmethionine:tRNA ribosyltransferase-isomerase
VTATTAPELLEAHEPPEVRGSGRDDVRLLVATRHDGRLADAGFRDLALFLEAGDVLVVNVSETLPAALDARLGAERVELRLSTETDDGRWIVEVRAAGGGRRALPPPGARLELPGGGSATVAEHLPGSDRLAAARLETTGAVVDYLHRHGRPIRYGYVPHDWPLAAYQTVFAREPGSAEMPSAGRPFTPALVTELVTAGVLIAPIVLHTGVSSPERGEPPTPERFRVPATTAALLRAVHGWGGRVVAVGTTVVRALETVAHEDGTVTAGAGWTDLVVTRERGLRAVDGLLTGFHEADSSHVRLLEAVAGADLLARSYAAAAAGGYRRHEFGDVHLILP